MNNDLAHIHRVDIEPQSYCNRICDWCPNKTLLRNYKEIMPDDIYTKLLFELDCANFGKTPLAFGYATKISFIGYQEIFSDVELLKKRASEAKEVLSNHVILTTNTNGDYLTKEKLDMLYNISVVIQDYDCHGKEYWESKLQEWGSYNIRYNENNHMLYGYRQNFISLIVVLDWAEVRELENRGGYFKEGDLPEMNWVNDMRPRTVPCPEPDYFINIYYDGSVTPCCHIRPDNPDHKEYILGNIHDTPLLDIYYSDKAEDFRKRLREPNGDYPEPCKYCQKIRDEICVGSPSGWNYNPHKYKEVSL